MCMYVYVCVRMYIFILYCQYREFYDKPSPKIKRSYNNNEDTKATTA